MRIVLEPFILLLELLLLEHKPRPWVVRTFRACVEFCRRVARLIRRHVSEPLPPGTPSAIVAAMQPPIYRTRMQMPDVFVNNTMMMIEAERRQHDSAARFAMQTPMPRFTNTLNA
jgi:hypothetical protein